MTMLSSYHLATCLQRCLTRGTAAVIHKSTVHRSMLLTCLFEHNLPCRTFVTICASSWHSDITQDSHPPGQPVRGMAGHSKWANIRHIKASKDSEKQRVSSKIAQRIKVVVREGGSADPKYNFLLARLLEDAKAKDVPKTTIENALKGLAKTKDKGSVVYVQAKGVGNCLLMVETFTEKSQRTRQEVQHVMKKFGATIGDSGLAQHSFQHKGCVYVPMENTEKKLTLDEAMDVAIETGAEEVEETHDDDGNRVLKFISDPKELHTVKKNLQQLDLLVSEARLEYIPNMFIQLTEEQLQVASQMFERLEELDEVIRVYDNIEAPQ